MAPPIHFPFQPETRQHSFRVGYALYAIGIDERSELLGGTTLKWERWYGPFHYDALKRAD